MRVSWGRRLVAAAALVAAFVAVVGPWSVRNTRLQRTFVAIDVSFRTPEPLGFDLGQLLVGLVHAGQVPAAMLPAIADRILTAYVDALAAEGLTGLDDDVRDAFTTSVLLRSGFDSFLFYLIGSDDPADRHTFDERVALCRFLADQYLELHPDD